MRDLCASLIYTPVAGRAVFPWTPCLPDSLAVSDEPTAPQNAARAEDEPAFDLLDDELMLLVLSHCSSLELGRLTSTARRFSEPTVLGQVLPTVRADTCKGDAEGHRHPPACSLVEVAARQRVNGHTLMEQQRVPRRHGEPNLSLMRELERLVQPIVFTSADAGVILSDGGSVATDCSTYMEHLPAVCGRVPMRAGVHYVEMVSLQGRTAMYGVVGVNFDPKYRMPAWKSQHAWMFGCFDGSLYHACTYRDWPGMQRTQVDDVVGLLLDLDAGSLAVFVNGVRLGLMVEGGLRGPLYWVADLYSSSISGASSVRVGDKRPACVLVQAGCPAVASGGGTPVQEKPPLARPLLPGASSPTPATHAALPASPPPAPLPMSLPPPPDGARASPPPPPLMMFPPPPLMMAPPPTGVTVNPRLAQTAANPPTHQLVQPLPLNTFNSITAQGGIPSSTARLMVAGVPPPDWFDSPMLIDPNLCYIKWP